MITSQHAISNSASISLQDKLDRAAEIGASSISGAAGGALLGSAFGGLTNGIIGAVAGFIINATIAGIYPATRRK